MKYYKHNINDSFVPLVDEKDKEVKPKVGLVYWSDEDNSYYIYEKVTRVGTKARPIRGNRYIAKVKMLIETKFKWYIFIMLFIYIVGILTGIILSEVIKWIMKH